MFACFPYFRDRHEALDHALQTPMHEWISAVDELWEWPDKNRLAMWTCFLLTTEALRQKADVPSEHIDTLAAAWRIGRKHLVGIRHEMCQVREKVAENAWERWQAKQRAMERQSMKRAVADPLIKALAEDDA